MTAAMRAFLFVTILFWLLCGCVTRPAPEVVAEPVLRPGDHFIVRLVRHGAVEERVVVNGDGDIRLPLVGELRVTGLTFRQAERLIESAYVPIEPPRLEVSVSRCP